MHLNSSMYIANLHKMFSRFWLDVQNLPNVHHIFQNYNWNLALANARGASADRYEINFSAIQLRPHLCYSLTVINRKDIFQCKNYDHFAFICLSYIFVFFHLCDLCFMLLDVNSAEFVSKAFMGLCFDNTQHLGSSSLSTWSWIMFWFWIVIVIIWKPLWDYVWIKTQPTIGSSWIKELLGFWNILYFSSI